MRHTPSFEYENALGGHLIAGVDEVGRAPLAGPVIAAAVILDISYIPEGICDSKQLSKTKRELLCTAIKKHAVCWSLGAASVAEIDKYNILQASLLAMHRAVSALATTPKHVLIDGNKLPDNLQIPATAIVKGDSKVISIAAASIIAKVTRDNIMSKLAQKYPYYLWESNSGYPVKSHLQALKQYGITAHHRNSFRPVRSLCSNYELLQAAE